MNSALPTAAVREFDRHAIEDLGFPGVVLMENAGRSLAEGDNDAALEAYSRIPLESPDSALVPHALYRIARIHQVQGERRLAEEELATVVQDYPLAALYDRSLKHLSDLCAAQGRYAESLEHLDAILFHDSLFTPEEIALRRCVILERWSFEDPDMQPRLIQAVSALKDLVGESGGVDPALREQIRALEERIRERRGGTEAQSSS